MRDMELESLSSHVDFSQLPDPSNRFQLRDVIGEGTYGEVYCALDLEQNKWVAVKVMDNIMESVEEIEEEYLILRDLCVHPNIPYFYGLFLKAGKKMDEAQLWFVMELCTGGSVTDLVQNLKRKGERLSELQIAYILRETMDAVSFLHSNHCMHRDVKGHNILLTEEAHIRLLDFGVSSHLPATMGRKNTSVGTPYWMAPEVIACEQQYEYSYDVRCDVWSVGITAIELADGDPPLCNVHPMRALFQIPRNPPPVLKRPSDWSDLFNDFIAECLIKDFEQRPVIKELMQHPFIKQVPQNPDSIRLQIKEEILRQREMGEDARSSAPEVTTKHGQLKSNRKSKLKKIYVDDLASLENLTEEVVVDQLSKRYSRSDIYTYIGDILIALNPYQDPGIYTTLESKKYRSRVRVDKPPHIYAVADVAYHAMMHHSQHQCIVISGESGAGKTESANLLLKQFVALGKAGSETLENKILQVNPIMEAFGNAKTGINDNSSRFGKFLELIFTKSGKITGAKVHVYLLEQSRVVSQAQGERNFHIFYYLCDGLEANNFLRKYHLRARTHKYLGESAMNSADSAANKAKFKNVVKGFELLGFKNDEIDTVYRILAAILNMGDISFAFAQNENNMEKCVISNMETVKIVANLLGVDVDDLVASITSNSVVTRGEIIRRNNTMSETVATRDAMSKALYGRLFDWMVNRINKLLSFGRQARDMLGVGLLDIFGFENFKKNSFEQLCINIANEQIQFYFNQHIFSLEQQEYESEEIDLDLITFSDNRPVLDMFLGKPLGLLALLDEESHFPNATDRTLVEKFHSNLKSRFYLKPKSNDINFTIQHYAGPVTYNGSHFLEKNRNFLPLEVIQLLRCSKYEIIRSQFKSPLTKTGNLYSAAVLTGKYFDSSNGTNHKMNELASQTRTQQTVATYFRHSLMDLLQRMVNGCPHFVRCIKPNNQNSPSIFDTGKVLSQLRYTGVLETIRIRQQGFSHRLTFAEFLRRYCFLAFDFNERVIACKENCKLLLVRLKMDGWALGRTKVFLKYYHIEFLSKLYEQRLRKIILIQAYVRRWLAKIRVNRERRLLVDGAVAIQKYTRGWLARKKFTGMNVVESLESRRESATVLANQYDDSIENGYRAYETRREDETSTRDDGSSLSTEEAAAVIQKYFKSWKSRQTVFEQLQKYKVDKANELSSLSQHVQVSNNHLNAMVRRSSSNIKPSDVEPIPDYYDENGASDTVRIRNRPDQFKRPGPKLTTVYDVGHYYDRLQDDHDQSKECKLEISFDDSWDAPLKRLEKFAPKQLRADNRISSPLPVAETRNMQATPVPLARQRKPVERNDSQRSQRESTFLPNQGPSRMSLEPNAHEFTRFLRNDSPLTRAQKPSAGSPTKSQSVGAVATDEDYGPYDFKKLLRKTNNAPTESLRLRRNQSSRK